MKRTPVYSTEVSAQAANRSWPDIDYSVAPDGMLALAWLVTAAAHSATASRNSASSERVPENLRERDIASRPPCGPVVRMDWCECWLMEP